MLSVFLYQNLWKININSSVEEYSDALSMLDASLERSLRATLPFNDFFELSLSLDFSVSELREKLDRVPRVL